MEKVVEDLPIEEWPSDPIEIDRYYEIPKVEIPDLIVFDYFTLDRI